MRNRRVGTVSMGVLLVALGILLLFAQFDSKTVFELLTKWWPLIFLILGAEILIYTFFAKEEHPKIKYDVFSIFIVIVIVFCGISAYGLTQIGIIEHLNMMISSQDFVLELPVEEITMDDSVKKVIINSPAQANLSIRTGNEANIFAFGTAYVTADTKENAEKMLEIAGILKQQIGDTLYLSFNTPRSRNEFNYHARVTEYSLVIPKSCPVEVNGDNHIDIMIDSLENNWLIDSNGSVEIRVASGANLEVDTVVRDRDSIMGNVDWTIKEKSEGEEIDSHERTIEGSVIFGEGNHRINILCDSIVTVNKL